ncbi:MAG: AsmA-like C-terminal region-containing protein, partial [Acidobacteriota bacterium]|nr:AsmA-like C-terminal region-containing protein [Acidobacteriota bacterium]
PPPGEPFRFEGKLDLDDIDPDALGELLRSAGLLETVPKGFFGGRQVSLSTEIDVGFNADSGELAIDKLAVDLDGSTFALEGRTATEGDARRIDLSLLPSQIRADHIRSLLAIVYTDAPVTFESGSPLEVEARISGLLGPGRLPDIEGRATVRGYTFHHPSLKTPMKEVGATLRIRRDRLEIDSLTAVIGSSDLTGDLTVTDFASPRVAFDIRSKNADFFELFSFMQPPEESGAATTSAADPAAEDLMRSVTVTGKITIDRGSFQKLGFTALAASMNWSDGVLRMDPFRMDLYDGTFNGTLTYRPFADPPSFAIGGNVAQVDLAPLLADSVGVEGLIAGRFTGEVSATGSGSDYETIARGMKGGGSARIENGFLGALDVLGTLSNVTGIFGEQTLSNLSRQMATDGTEFSSATTTIKVDGGKLRLDNLQIRSPALDLNGRGDVGLLDQALDGALQIEFSREVSDSMRAENSRAGKVFWNDRSSRVEFPFELAGSLAEPSVGVDWNKAAKTYVEREARSKLDEIISDKLGVSLGGKKAGEPQSV